MSATAGDLRQVLDREMKSFPLNSVMAFKWCVSVSRLRCSDGSSGSHRYMELLCSENGVGAGKALLLDKDTVRSEGRLPMHVSRRSTLGSLT